MSEKSATSHSNVFKLSRVFDAPRVRVFNAWTDPNLMAKWWGPHNFTNPIFELDVRAGGAMYIVMRSPDGRTLLKLETIFDTIELRNAMIEMGMNEGWGQSLDKLQALPH
ncbi:MAG: SRPBCC domain-containing protein [Candidatus Kapaibacterium sp.]|jgi:uncharacterized protein YndB with AHSA1/START domain